MTLAGKSPALAVSLCLCGFVLLGCGESPRSSNDGPVILSGSTMGTYYRVTLAAIPTTLGEGELQASIDTRLGKINTGMSTYLSDSEVSRFNRYTGKDWFPVSADTATVVAEALQIFRQSEGAFDITVGPLVDLWGFGPPEGTRSIPSPESIENTLKKVGSQHLHVRLSPPAIKKSETSDVQIDLSGIAKGFAVDSVADSLEEFGVTDYLVDIGGEMLARGRKKDGSSWTIAIESPIVNERSIHKTIAVSDQAIATSGDYRNYFESDGKRYSHEIDPRTGRSIQHRLVSVTVLAPSCMLADAWATALIVLGPKRGLQSAEGENLAAFFIIKGDEGFLEKKSSAFDRLSADNQ
jgi:thiamine biosynthesis lipoprotein